MDEWSAIENAQRRAERQDEERRQARARRHLRVIPGIPPERPQATETAPVPTPDQMAPISPEAPAVEAAPPPDPVVGLRLLTRYLRGHFPKEDR